MKEFGTKIVAGITPGKGGEEVYGIPVYNSVEDAMETGANTSIIFVPAPSAMDAVIETTALNLFIMACAKGQGL